MQACLSLETLTVKTLAAKPCVQRALQSPMRPESVLSFFFGVDCSTPEGSQSLKDGSCLAAVTPLWFMGGAEYDDLCRPFAETVRAAGTRALPTWNDSASGLTAQIVLTDQLARNIFRGTPEAFAYEDVSLDIVRQLAASTLTDATTSMADEMNPSFLTIMILVMMHSEDRADHVTCLQLLDHARAMTQSSPAAQALQAWWDEQTTFELNHKAVVDRFGRYPHRNQAKNRQSTPEELAWLADTESLPQWALSQDKVTTA